MINNYIALAMFLFLVIITVWFRINKYNELNNFSEDKLLYNNQSKWKYIFFLVLFVIFFFSFSYELFYKIFTHESIQLHFGNDMVSSFIYSLFTFTMAYRYKDPVILKDDSIKNVKHEKITGYYFRNHLFGDKMKCVFLYNLFWNFNVSFSIVSLDDSQKEKLENYLISYGIEKRE